MVCTYCGGETQVTNSRHQKRLNQVWRRRHCLSCGATFSTHEAAVYEDSWRVLDARGHMHPFLRNKLFLSLHKSLEHRKRSVEDATGITNTVVSLLLSQADKGVLEPNSIALTAYEVLGNFDKAASTHYAAFHDL
jgi:transcriptional regulator NrdR family protein